MKIRHIPCQPHCFAFGGFELQMLGAMRAVSKLGIDSAPLDFWRRSADFDIIHSWGLINNYSLYWGRKAGKKIVATVLLRNIDSIYQNLHFRLSGVLGSIRSQLQVVPMLDAMVVVNEQDANIAVKYYGVSRNKIHIIPNIINSVYFCESNTLSNLNYVHCSGNISSRKNQLNLVIACSRLKIKLILTGDVIPGEEEYAKKIEDISRRDPNIIWHKSFPENSPELLAICRGSSIFALPSFNEKQPISVLEAIALGKPVLLGDRSYAKQKCFFGAYLVDPSSINSIVLALKTILVNPQRYCISKERISDCTEESVGRSYVSVYRSLLEGK